jgi:hypothetical protein
MGNTVSDGFPSPDGSAKKSVGITPDAPSQKLLTSGEEVNANVPVLDNNEAIIKSLPAGLWGKCKLSRFSLAKVRYLCLCLTLPLHR